MRLRTVDAFQRNYGLLHEFLSASEPFLSGVFIGMPGPSAPVRLDLTVNYPQDYTMCTRV